MSERLARLYLVVLAGLVLGFQCADVITTLIGVSLGHVESNPIANAVGLPDFIALKMLLMVSFVWFALRLNNMVGATILAFAASASMFAVLNNIHKIIGG